MHLFSNFSLTEEEIDYLSRITVFSEREIEFMYNRFIYLDRSNNGYLTCFDLQFIPELDANPFSILIINYLETKSQYKEINFQVFLQFLSIFSEKTDWTKRCDFFFDIFDLNGNGKLTKRVLKKIYTIMGGVTDVKKNIKELFRYYDKNKKKYIDKNDFTRLYKNDPSIEKKSVIDFKKSFCEIKKSTLWDILWPSGNKY